MLKNLNNFLDKHIMTIGIIGAFIFGTIWYLNVKSEQREALYQACIDMNFDDMDDIEERKANCRPLLD